ncbi:MAG TPA: hypothetical protein DEF41_00495 [Desulfovibrio sp.]|uniref:Uncharacterized protein n=1 Tax=Nitratidesulfovibrio vulgaris (strain ATCC 29579 / DSM 644 / CCUG 34227 / NCIMB 8303 / VKM B-1760 / Hildenborough) TaxID=882 RepID=Q72FN9_NITV2|nr:hypothetical protein DVU_0174 [Nitratidesulfovibrio vulgaris str. Hildenborough]HBW14634.1 hypothetical protein [Desulfovibrio sp.]
MSHVGHFLVQDVTHFATAWNLAGHKGRGYVVLRTT